MKCVKIPNNKNSHLTVKRDVEMTNDKIIKKNDSLQNFQEYPVPGHSTPIIEKHCAKNAEDSPKLDYYTSPTLLPLTQEVDEIAWDWQSSLSKTPESKIKKQNAHNQCETPKGTKFLQRKRNSNSPLLYKPLKRKTIKMKNMENIGQFAAELQALNERVRFIKQNDKSYSDNHNEEEEASNLVNTNSEQEMSKDKNNEQNCIEETNNDGNIVKNNTSESYDDLFDDSVDESMIKCTQEMEEKFNLMDKENFTHTQVNTKKKESPPVDKATVKTSVELISNENFRKSPTKIILCKDRNDSDTLKTYSRLSLKKDTSIHAATQRDEDRQIANKSHLNNNNDNMINTYTKSCDNKRLSKRDSTELFDFPDDSFDDWLATCVEDEKLSAFNDSLTRRTKPDSTKFGASYKGLTHASLKSEVKSTSSLKSTMKMDEPPSSIFENRKFFKTKSLSDQYFGQNAKTNAKSTTMLHVNSTISNANVARTSVSRNPIVTVTNDCKEGSTISLMRSANPHRSGVRCSIKEGGDRFVKHYSTGNIKNNPKETMKTNSQSAGCTAEEIENKRLQALMKLKMSSIRKLQSMNVVKNINR